MTELLIVLVLVLANGLFAGAEIAVLTARKNRLQERAAAGDRNALAVASLRERPERFLATVQIGITVISAAAAAFGGSAMAANLEPVLEPILGDSAGEVAFALVITFVAFLSLVLGELVPKSLALRYADGYAFFIGRPLYGLSRVMRPVVWFLTACSNVVLRFFGDSTSFTESRMSRDELRQMVEEAGTAGSVDMHSSEIASRALDMADVMVAEIMVPRLDMTALALDTPPDEVQRRLLGEAHSRVPVYDQDLDRVVGYVVTREVLAQVIEGAPIQLAELLRPIFTVPLVMKISVALREMQTKRVQLALVTDEHGGTAGLVTIEDVMEELVGDITNEGEEPDHAIVRKPDGSALVPGWMPIRKLNRALHLDLPIARESTTVAGLCLALALAVPAIGAKLTSPDGTLLEVVDATPRRVRMVRVHRRAPVAVMAEGSAQR